MTSTVILTSANGAAISEGGFDGGAGTYVNLHGNDGFTSVYGITEQTYAVDKVIPMAASPAIPTNAKMTGNMTLQIYSGKRGSNGYTGSASVYKTSTSTLLATCGAPSTQDVMNVASHSPAATPTLTPTVCNSDLSLLLHVDGDAFASGGAFNNADMLAWTYASFTVVWHLPSGGFGFLVSGLVGAALGLHELPALAREFWKRTGHLITPDEYRRVWREVREAKRRAYSFSASARTLAA